MTRRQDGVIVAGVPLSGRDVANAAVAMIDVVPVHEAGCPGARRVEVGKAFGRKLRPVLGGAEQRLGIGVVFRAVSFYRAAGMAFVGSARGSVDNPVMPDSGLAAAQIPVDSPWTTRRPPAAHRSAVAHEFHRLQATETIENPQAKSFAERPPYAEELPDGRAVSAVAGAAGPAPPSSLP